MFCELARETVADALASRALYHTYLERLLDVSQKESSRQATNEALLCFDEIVSKVDFKQYVLTMDTPRLSKTNKLKVKGEPSWKPKGTNVNKTDLFDDPPRTGSWDRIPIHTVSPADNEQTVRRERRCHNYC